MPLLLNMQKENLCCNGIYNETGYFPDIYNSKRMKRKLGYPIKILRIP
jgi:hypothetical protein